MYMESKVKSLHEIGATLSSTSKLKFRKRTVSTKVIRNFYGCFMNDNVRPVDFVLVYANEEEEESSSDDKDRKRRSFFEENLTKQGCELETTKIINGQERLTFVKMHVPFTLMSRRAETLKLKMPLWVHDHAVDNFINVDNDDSQPIYKKIYQLLKTFLCCLDRKSPNFDPDTIILWPFEKRHVTQYAIVDKDKFFLNRQRIEIAWDILQRTPNDEKDPKKRGIESLLKHGIYESVYPLHEGDPDAPKTVPEEMLTLRQRLKRNWANWSCIANLQPLHDIRNYFGEKIGFYFAFMDFYLKWLIPPSLVGIIVFSWGLNDTSDSEEPKNICNPPTGDPDSEENMYNVADYWMCPICQPPNCEATRMADEFCTQYLWSWRLDNEATVGIACLIPLWAILFLKFWRRREASLACQWDTFDVEEYDSGIRPDYEEQAKTTRKNPVTREPEPYIPQNILIRRLFVSSMATFCLLCLALLGLAGLVMSRIALYGVFKHAGGIIAEKNVEFCRYTVHGGIFIMVSLFEKFYHTVAHKLTSYECPKTETAFMSSLLWKIFIFALLNDFVPIAYASWFKGKNIRTPLELNFYSELCNGGCMGEVTELVAILLLARLVIGNLAEIGLPLISRLIKRCKNMKKVDKEGNGFPSLPQWQTDFHLEEAELDGVYDEYMEMMIQFAFIVLFIPAFPVAPIVCFLNNIAEIRVDAFNLMFQNRRPLPIRVPGIQIWNQFMDIIVKLGIICNAALISFTSDMINFFYYDYFVNPEAGGAGYTQYIISSVLTNGWPEEDAEEMELKNITQCYYGGYRLPYPPYDRKNFYFQILAFKVVVFITYCLVFFILMWLVNTFIDSVPENVKLKIKRRQYVVLKAREAEEALYQTKWAENGHGFHGNENNLDVEPSGSSVEEW